MKAAIDARLIAGVVRPVFIRLRSVYHNDAIHYQVRSGPAALVGS